MKLTGWLFEEQENQNYAFDFNVKKSLIDDFVEGVLKTQSLFTTAQPDEEQSGLDFGRWLLIENFYNSNKINSINLYLTYSKSFGEILSVFLSTKRNGQFKDIIRLDLGKLLIEQPEINTYEGFNKLLLGLGNLITEKIEQYKELVNRVPVVEQEIYDYLSSQPGKFRVLTSSPISFNIVNNPRIFDDALVEVTINPATDKAITRIRFLFNEPDGEDWVGVIRLTREETFKQIFEREWPEIEREIESRFAGDEE